MASVPSVSRVARSVFSVSQSYFLLVAAQPPCNSIHKNHLKKHDSPMTRNASGGWVSFGILSFGIWNFFGIWDFGIWDLRRSRPLPSV